MPRFKRAAPPQDPIEQDFLDAIERLRDGKPTRKELKARKANGTLRVNIASVSLEAGHSRTLIALETGCRYPRVRELIKQAKSGRTALPTTVSEVNARQRAENVNLQVQLKIYQATVLVHFKARDKAEKAAAREREAASRLRKQIASMGKVVVIASKEAE
jgi:hypothetical protein